MGTRRPLTASALSRTCSPDNRYREARASQRLSGSSAHSLTGQQWAEQFTGVAREQGWLQPGGSLRISSLPPLLLRLGGLLLPTWAALSDVLYLWRTPHRLANDRLVALIGPEPHTPLSQAVRSALAGLGLLKEPPEN